MLKMFIATGAIAAVIAAAFNLNPSGATDDAKNLCDEVLNFLGQKEYAKCFSSIREQSLNPMSDDEFNDWSNAQSRSLEAFNTKYGSLIGNELVEEKKFNETLRKYIYITKYDKTILCWSFIFYRPHDKWKVLTFNFNNRENTLDSLFK